MDQYAFASLRRDTFIALGVPHSLCATDEGQRHVDGFEVGIFRDQRASAIHCYVDVGIVPEQRKAAVHEELLRLNLLAMKAGAAFAIDPASGNALLVTRMQPGSSFGPERLARVLRGHLALTRGIRERLLEAQQRESAAVSPNALA